MPFHITILKCIKQLFYWFTNIFEIKLFVCNNVILLVDILFSLINKNKLEHDYWYKH